MVVGCMHVATCDMAEKEGGRKKEDTRREGKVERKEERKGKGRVKQGVS